MPIGCRCGRLPHPPAAPQALGGRHGGQTPADPTSANGLTGPPWSYIWPAEPPHVHPRDAEPGVPPGLNAVGHGLLRHQRLHQSLGRGSGCRPMAGLLLPERSDLASHDR
eukprot:197974-Pyramimonas_sp.AAC.1